MALILFLFRIKVNRNLKFEIFTGFYIKVVYEFTFGTKGLFLHNYRELQEKFLEQTSEINMKIHLMDVFCFEINENKNLKFEIFTGIHMKHM